MSTSQIIGAVWLLAGLVFVMWRAHKEGELVPLLQGAGYMALILAFIGIGLQLLLNTQWT
jgi:hypothetical protein